jgi:hypothetical protein
MQFNTFIKGLSRLRKEPMKLSFKSKETYERGENISLPCHIVSQDKFSHVTKNSNNKYPDFRNGRIKTLSLLDCTFVIV